KTAGQHVQEKAMHELERSESTDLLASRAKDDLLVADLEQTVIRDGHAMGVKPQIAKERRWAAKSRLCVDAPVLLVKRVFETSECRRLCQRRADLIATRARCELALREQTREPSEEFPPKQRREHLH